jgi:hypothetical protein
VSLLVLVSGCEHTAHQERESRELECVGYCKLKLGTINTRVIGSGKVEVENENTGSVSDTDTP